MSLVMDAFNSFSALRRAAAEIFGEERLPLLLRGRRRRVGEARVCMVDGCCCALWVVVVVVGVVGVWLQVGRVITLVLLQCCTLSPRYRYTQFVGQFRLGQVYPSPRFNRYKATDKGRFAHKTQDMCPNP